MAVPGGDIAGAGARRPRPVAVVYSDDFTGPADGDDTGALAAILASAAGWNFDVITTGPNGSISHSVFKPIKMLYTELATKPGLTCIASRYPVSGTYAYRAAGYV